MAGIVRFYKIKEIFRLSFSLAKVRFILRMEGSYLGFFWYFLSPLALFAIILFVKSAAFSDLPIAYYPLYLFIGISGANFFRVVLSNSIKAISANADHLKSVNNVSPAVLVLSGVLLAIFSHLFELALLVALMIYFKISLIGLLFYLPIFFGFALMVLGISFIFATVGVYVNDLDNIWTIASQLLFLATPTFYAVAVGSAVYTANLFNPLFYFLEIARRALIYASWPPLWMTLIFIGLILGFLVFGLAIFNKHKKKFAELV